MRALVTGGSGFIGAWIIAALQAKGFEIRSFDISDNLSVAEQILGDAAGTVDWQVGDIADHDAVREASKDCDALVHLAALLTPACQADPIRGVNVNLVGSLNVFEAARKHGINRVLYMSSAGVFGPEHARVPEPTTLYGAYKLAMEGAARAYWEDHKIASVGFRPLIVYGPGRETGMTAAPSLACRAAAAGKNAPIPFSGTTDFVYVTDVADAYAAALDGPIEGARVYNITGEECLVSVFAKTIEHHAPGVSITTCGPSLPISAGMDGASLRQDFPAVPLTSVDDGVRATIAFYKDRQ